MKKNSFSVMVSIDGPKKENNRNRVNSKDQGTYDLVIKNIIAANKIIPLTFRATITNDNLNLVEIASHFKGLGAKMITFGLDNNNLSRENYRKIMESYEELTEMYYQDLAKGELYEITNFSQIFFQLLFKERKISHCNAGLSYLGVAADGLMYKCPRFTDIQGHQFADIQNLERVERKLKLFRTELRKDARYRNTYCAKCPFVFLCGGLCHYDLFQKKKSVYGHISEQCRLRKKIYLETIKLYAKLSEEVKKEFFYKITDLTIKGGD